MQALSPLEVDMEERTALSALAPRAVVRGKIRPSGLRLLCEHGAAKKCVPCSRRREYGVARLRVYAKAGYYAPDTLSYSVGARQEQGETMSVAGLICPRDDAGGGT